MERFISQEIIYEIASFIEYIKDYISLSQVNKYFYNSLLIEENNTFHNTFNNFFKKHYFYLADKNYMLPNYLFKLKYIDFNNVIKSDLLDKFINLKNLNISKVSKDINFIFPKLELLEELIINESTLPSNSLQNLNQLKVLKLINCDNNEKLNLEFLINLKELTVIKSIISSQSLKYLQQLEYLNINNAENNNNLINDADLGKLKNLKVLFINGMNTFNFLKRLTNLETFNNLQQLKYLYIDDFFIQSNDFKQLPNLEEASCNLSDLDNLNYLKNIKKLRIKKLSIRRVFRDEDLIELPNIVELNLQFNKDVTEIEYKGTNIKEEYLQKLKGLSKNIKETNEKRMIYFGSSHIQNIRIKLKKTINKK
ncbi:hypothetical protein ABK040_012631 [Willaertia magna]